MTHPQNSDERTHRYFTVEFKCDNLAQAQQLCAELQEKYDISFRKPEGISISAWRDGSMVEESNND